MALARKGVQTAAFGGEKVRIASGRWLIFLPIAGIAYGL
jgi:hypothetical protein